VKKHTKKTYVEKEEQEQIMRMSINVPIFIPYLSARLSLEGIEYHSRVGQQLFIQFFLMNAKHSRPHRLP